MDAFACEKYARAADGAGPVTQSEIHVPMLLGRKMPYIWTWSITAMPSEVRADRVAMAGDYRFSSAQVAAAFSEQELSYWDQPARFKVLELGAVVITSGAVVVDDPMFGWMAAFERRISPGTYAVSVALVQLSSGDERIAYARMQLTSAAVVAWETGWYEPVPETVMRDGKQHAVPRQYAFYCSVETGIGCFMDAAVIPVIRKGDYNAYVATMMDGLARNRRNTWSWFAYEPDPSRRENVVCYQTEPGCYPSHFGLDARGEAAIIVTDFQMF